MGNNNGALDKCEKIGFKVIEVGKGSPGEQCGLVPFTDFIINVNGYPLHTMTKDAIEYLVKRSENQTLQIEVYDTTTSSSRMVDITPSRNWNGEGLLGIVIRLEQYEADANGEFVKPQEDIDVSFDNIYHDFEAAGDGKGGKKNSTDGATKQRGSQIFSRKSFSNGSSNAASSNTPDATKNSSSNYLSASNPAFEDTDYATYTQQQQMETPSRRSSGSSKIMKVFSFSPKTPSTEGTSDLEESGSRRSSLSPGGSEETGKQAKRKSSSVFRKFSFTSSTA